MSEKPKPGPTPWKLLPPFLIATALAVAIHLSDPSQGVIAWGSAWIATFLMLSVFALIIRP